MHPTELAGMNCGQAEQGPPARVPPGYLTADTGQFGLRTTYTDPTDLPPTTWTSDNVLKFSASEKLMRGRKAKVLAAQVCVHSLNLHVYGASGDMILPCAQLCVLCCSALRESCAHEQTLLILISILDPGASSDSTGAAWQDPSAEGQDH